MPYVNTLIEHTPLYLNHMRYIYMHHVYTASNIGVSLCSPSGYSTGLLTKGYQVQCSAAVVISLSKELYLHCMLQSTQLY